MKSQLTSATQSLNLVDTDKIFEQGIRAFNALFTRSANPFKSDRDRGVWDKGWSEGQRVWGETQRRWREQERSS
jgi:hypothetical protein